MEKIIKGIAEFQKKDFKEREKIIQNACHRTISGWYFLLPALIPE